jgi:hypothetical protein
MVEEKKQGKFFIGNYIGRELVKQNPDPKEGAWKSMYKLSFKENESDMYAKKVAAFNNCKGFDSLVEGKDYTVGYNESEPKWNEKAQKTVVYKTAFWIGTPKEHTVNALPKDAVPTQQKPVTNYTTLAKDVILQINELKDFLDGDMFQKNYLEIVPSKVKCNCGEEISIAQDVGFQSVNHMVGSYIRTYFPEHFERLISACKLSLSEGKK